MNFEYTDRQKQLIGAVSDFLEEWVYPAESVIKQQIADFGDNRWQVIPELEKLKLQARQAGLWNMFMPPSSGQTHVDESFEFEGLQLTNVEFAAVAELLGRMPYASEVFNCSPPDTGNMEVLHRYGTLAQKERWLRPLMNGEVRSAFLMTEPAVASSDATNIQTRIERDGEHYVINGRKWWSSGVGDPRCKLAIVMGKTDPDAPVHGQQSMLLVPMNTPGVKPIRSLRVYGFDHAPHGQFEVLLENVRVPVEDSLLLGEGRGFDIAQGRLGPGRIHHCMRSIGAAEVALEKMVARLLSRKAFGKHISQYSVWEERIARARIDIDMTRLLCLKAADMMDRRGNKSARLEIAMIKIQAPYMALKVLDDAIQAHGGGGVSDEDFGLSSQWAYQRTLRIADGPDEVHNRTIARMEMAKQQALYDAVRSEGRRSGTS
jgi:acyl-CoA dehydrogenase